MIIRSAIAWPGISVYFFLCVSALPAKVFVTRFVRPSSSALAALLATEVEVSLLVRDCARTLPAKDLAVLLEPGFRRTLEASCDTRLDVFSLFAISITTKCINTIDA
ncbi:hypothetical protein RHOFW104R8_05020 [Rhodanobacter sp. FW104-R8]|nr:hypothetical protein RHOFW104R8_05020 [Rhodanobacter sp. FW104-R8]KZC27325.1 hypothetical protein RhoFW510T8_16680 [Rhodanobacter sp. FW510-T8]